MRDDAIEKLRRVLAAASPGPWRRCVDGDDVRVCRLPEDGAAMCVACVALAGETLDGVEWTPETLARWRADALAIAVLGTIHPELLAVAEAAAEPICGEAEDRLDDAVDALDDAIERALPEPE